VLSSLVSTYIYKEKAESEEINECVLMDMEEQRSLEETSTWAVSVFCFFFLLTSLIIEGSLHKLAEVLLAKYIYSEFP